jgi:hypothetical protein
MASEEVRGSFCRYDSCVITDQLATDAGALERELLMLGRTVECYLERGIMVSHSTHQTGLVGATVAAGGQGQRQAQVSSRIKSHGLAAHFMVQGIRSATSGAPGSPQVNMR